MPAPRPSIFHANTRQQCRVLKGGVGKLEEVGVNPSTSLPTSNPPALPSATAGTKRHPDSAAVKPVRERNYQPGADPAMDRAMALFHEKRARSGRRLKQRADAEAGAAERSAREDRADA
jgi:hypothetical protein